jgi:hypothetical protein
VLLSVTPILSNLMCCDLCPKYMIQHLVMGNGWMDEREISVKIGNSGSCMCACGMDRQDGYK